MNLRTVHGRGANEAAIRQFCAASTDAVFVCGAPICAASYSGAVEHADGVAAAIRILSAVVTGGTGLDAGAGRSRRTDQVPLRCLGAATGRTVAIGAASGRTRSSIFSRHADSVTTAIWVVVVTGICGLRAHRRIRARIGGAPGQDRRQRQPSHVADGNRPSYADKLDVSSGKMH